MAENKLNVIDLHKRYGEHEVLKGVSLTVILWKNLLASTGLYEIIPGFILSFISIVVVSLLEKAPSAEVVQRFEQADALYKKEMAELKNQG